MSRRLDSATQARLDAIVARNVQQAEITVWREKCAKRHCYGPVAPDGVMGQNVVPMSAFKRKAKR